MGGFLRRHKTSGLMPLGEALGGDGVMGRYLAEVPVQIVGTMARAGLDRLRATGTRMDLRDVVRHCAGWPRQIRLADLAQRPR
jgi:hypothetical protein